jgi:hypothetical protein
MIHKKSEKGQAIIVITFAIIGLIGLTGLAIDGSLAYAAQRKAQNTADTAAYAAALAAIRGKNAAQAAQGIAAANGGSDVVVEVNNPPGPDCKGNANSFTNNNEYTQVIIKSSTKTTFGSIIGFKEVNNCAEAITHVIPATAGVSAGSFGGAGVVSLALDGKSYDMSGSGKIIATKGGVFANSSATPSVVMSGDPIVCLDPGYSIGVPAASGGTSICNWCVQDTSCPVLQRTNALPAVTNGVSQYTQAQINAFLATVPPMPSPPDGCSTATVRTFNDPSSGGVLSSVKAGHAGTHADPWHILPGSYPTGINTEGAGSYMMESGLYCLTGTKGFFGDNVAEIYSPNSDIVIVTTGTNDVTMQGGTDFTANSLEVYTDKGTWTVTGGSDLYADKLRFFGSCGTNCGTISVNGTTMPRNSMVVTGDTKIRGKAGGDTPVPDAFFYFNAGIPNWNNGSSVSVNAPTSGPFKGLLVNLPWSNTTPIVFEGGTNYSTKGTFLAPHNQVSITAGNSSVVSNSQFIAYRFVFSGSGTLNLNYGAADNFGAASPTDPKIQLVK